MSFYRKTQKDKLESKSSNFKKYLVRVITPTFSYRLATSKICRKHFFSKV